MASTNGTDRCGPWPIRRYGWSLQLDDGATVREFYDQPPATRWTDQDPEQIERLDVIDCWPTSQEHGPVVEIHARTGRLVVRGQQVDIRLGGERVTNRSDLELEIHQRKHAVATFDPATGRQAQGVRCIEAALARPLLGHAVRVEARVHMATGSVGLGVSVGGRGPLEDAPVEVLVEDEPVRDAETWFARAGRPPGEA